MDFVAIDFETANEDHASACALGLADVRDGEIVENKSWLIRPPKKVSDFTNQKIHGIGPSKVKNSPEFDSIYDDLLPYIANRIVVAHQAVGTECEVLHRLFGHFEIAPPDFKVLCTKEVSEKLPLATELEKFGLKDIANHFGIEFVHHDPKEDARACATILLKLCEECGISSLSDLSKEYAVKISPFVKIQKSKLRKRASGSMAARAENKSFNKESIKGRCKTLGFFDSGTKLFSNNKVKVTQKDQFECCGEVEGSKGKVYQVTIFSHVESKCDCPSWRNNSGHFCKHSVALALAWESEGGPKLLSDVIDQLNIDQCKLIIEQIAANDPGLVMSAISAEDDQ